MATNKKSFVLYSDLIHVVKKLPPEKQGELFMHILRYVNGENPTADDPLIDIVFEPIRLTLKRDLALWEEQRNKRVEAGRKGGLKRASNAKQKKAKPSNAKQSQANQAVNVNVNVNEINIYRSFNHLSLTKEEFDKLNETYTKEQIDNTLDAIENYKGNKNYKSLYLTLNNWLKKQHPEGKNDNIRNGINYNNPSLANPYKNR